MTRTRVAVAGILALAVLVGIGAIGWGLGRASAPEPPIVVAAGPAPSAAATIDTLPNALSSPTSTPSLSPSTAPLPVLLTAAPGLTNTPTTASGFRVTRAGIDPIALASQLALAFGITDDPRSSSSQVVVGDNPDVTVNLTPLLTWEFADARAAASAPPGKLPTRQQAIDVSSTLLGKLGVDIASVDWQVDRVDQGVRVTGWQLVVGQRSSLSWTVTIGRSGSVVSATGFAAGLQEVPGYTVVGAAFAVQRSGIAPWTALPPVAVVAAPAPAASPTAAPDGRLQVPTQQVVVTDAVLGLAQYAQPDGSLLILPSYRLNGADGSAWSILAITGTDVSFGPDPTPSAP